MNEMKSLTLNGKTYASFRDQEARDTLKDMQTSSGSPGKDGVSVTHEWNGTVLEVTSASGTSSADLKGETGATGATGPKGADGYTPVKGVDYFTEEDKQEIAGMVVQTEAMPSPNLININDTESWPFGISETEAVKGLYSWIDGDGYIHIKGTATEGCSLYLMLDSGDTVFEPGTYYICFDDVLRMNDNGAIIRFIGTDNKQWAEAWANVNDAKPKLTVTLTEAVTAKKIDLYFQKGATIDFKGHCWMTKDEVLESFAPKGGTISVPITPAKKEDIEKLEDLNILGIFDTLGGVGDSLMSGYINPTDDNAGSDTHCYSKSWLSQISKMLGISVKHYSYAGATAKNWMQNQNDCHADIVTEPCEAYFLALGTNDSADWANIPVGTAADMGTDADTFYGWYAKVIDRIRQANPKAPIFMLSLYWTGFSEYDNAIKAMSQLTQNAYYIDITDMGSVHSQYRQGYHFNAMGYYYIAKSIIQRMSELIVANSPDFANLGVEA